LAAAGASPSKRIDARIGAEAEEDDRRVAVVRQHLIGAAPEVDVPDASADRSRQARAEPRERRLHRSLREGQEQDVGLARPGAAALETETRLYAGRGRLSGRFSLRGRR
jgi:hypothetical protein